MVDYSGTVNALNSSYLAVLEQAKRNDNAYVALASTADGPEVSSEGGTLNLHLANPSTSGVSADVAKFIPSAAFSGWFRVHDEFTTDPSGGDPDGMDSLLMDSDGDPADSALNAAQDVSFEGGDSHVDVVLPAGGTPANQVGGIAQGTEPIIEPNREIVVEIENTSGSGGNAAIAVVFSEIDDVFSTS